MRNIIGVYCMISIFSVASVPDLNVSNECEGLDITKLEYKYHKKYMGGQHIGIQYGLKNKTQEDIKISIDIYPKDIKGQRIGESHFKEELKSNYEYPFKESSYYPIGSDMTSFSGNSDMVITCIKKEEKKGMNNKSGTVSINGTKFVDIRIPKKLYDMIAEKENVKGDLMIRLKILEILSRQK